MMNTLQFKKHYEECEKVFPVDLEQLNFIINKWKEFREKIINKNLTVEQYNGKNEYFSNEDEYCLRYFCETVATQKFFGSLGGMPSYNSGLWITDYGDVNDKKVYYNAPKDATARQPLNDTEIAEKLDKIRDFLYKLVTIYKWDNLISFLDSNEVFNEIPAKNFIFEIVFLNSLLSKDDLIENKDKNDDAKVELDYYLKLIQIYAYEEYEKIKFLSECKRESHSNEKILPFIKSKKALELSQKALGISDMSREIIYTLNWALWYAKTGILTSGLDKKVYKSIIDGHKQIILTGAPGTGKTFTAKNVAQHFPHAAKISDGFNENGEKIDIKYKIVQFHPSIDYSDFIEGLRPIQLKADQNPTFVRFDGVFKKFCRFVVEENNNTAENDSESEKIYFFIIDEINRADLSKVFGELMYSLEYRGAMGKVQTQYANLKTYYYDDNNEIKCYNQNDDVFYDGFFIPENIYIIGTMNDIDRSVESFDFALRRRFKWYEVNASDVMDDVLKNFIKKDEDRKEIVNIMEQLNKAIYDENDENEMGLSKAYHIGPAYLKSLKGVRGKLFSKLQDIYKDEIESIIYEYVRGRDPYQIKLFLEKCRTAFCLDKNYKFIEKKSKKVANQNDINETTGVTINEDVNS